MGKSILSGLIITFIVFVTACSNNHTDDKSRNIEQVKTVEELRAEQEKRERELLAYQEQQRQEQELLEKQAIEEQKKRLGAEIKLLDRSFNISGHSVGEMNSLVSDMRTRAKMIREGESSDINEVKDLANKLKIKAVAYQIKAFPMMRRNYAVGLNKELWIVDGKAYVSGGGNIYITVVSPELVLNKQKQEAHSTIYRTLNNLRFRQARYKYYDGSEYTYWTVFEGRDADLIE